MINWMLTTLFCSIILFSSCPHLHAEIIETQNIATVMDHVDANSIVFFNVTGTLYKPSTTFADRQWRDYFSERVLLIVPEANNPQNLINRIKNTLVQEIPKKNVDEFTPILIANLQQARVPVLGITQKKVSTPYANDFAQITSNHLVSLGIYLESTLAYFNIPHMDCDQYSFGHGILFTEKKAAGNAILAILKNTQHLYSNVIVVDDSQNFLRIVETTLAENNIPFVGLRYGRDDARKANFNPILGIIEFIAFINEGKVMTDEEATDILITHPEVDYEQLLNELILQLV